LLAEGRAAIEDAAERLAQAQKQLDVGNYTDAVALLKELEQEYNPDATFELGRLYWHGCGVAVNKERAIDLLFDPVTLAHFEVRFIVQVLGVQHLLQLAAQLDCKDDAGRSFRILTILSEQNCASAQYQLATIYERIGSIGIKHALRTAVLLYAAASEAGIDEAYSNLRELIEQRIVGEREVASAFDESNPFMG